ncbi:hypothetical protein [Streptomyces sp. NPDC002845]
MTAPGTREGAVPLDADRVKHLEFIQAVITRMSGNSFLIKGWALTLAAALFAVSADRRSWAVAVSGLVPLACFWFLDGFFLRQEKLFRLLYEDVRRPDHPVEVFSMNVQPYAGRVRPLEATFSHTLTLFYGALLLTDVLLVVVNL